MPDTLTESFCERCGTRYEFKAPTRLNPLRKTRGLFGGLKNYLTSQDALSDAIGDAMRSEEDQLASAQLEAFHESFNFCISCRQYTCLNCWNDGAGRCRTCAPIPGTDDLTERLAASLAGNGAAAGGAVAQAEPSPSDLSGDDAHRRPGLDAWPSVDMPALSAGTNGRAAEGWPAADELSPAAGFEPEPEAIAAELEHVSDEVEPQPESLVAEVEPELEPVVAEVEPELEPVVTDAEPEPAPFVAEVEPDAEVFVSEAEPEPFVAEAETEPAPMVAEVEPEPVMAGWEPAAGVSEPVFVEAEAETEPAVAELEPEPTAAELEWPEVAAEAASQTEGATIENDAEASRPLLRVVAWDEDAQYDVLHETAALEPEPEPMVAEVDPEPEPVVAEVEPEPEPMVAEVEPEPEPVVAEVEPEPELEPVVAEVEPEPEPMVAEVEPEPEPEPVVAEVEPEPPAPRIRPISETILHFPAQSTPASQAPEPTEATEPVAAEAETPEVAARRAQLDLLGLGDPGEGPVAPSRPAVLPYRSRGATPTPGELAARAAGATFWEASAREVAEAAAQVGVQNCGQCGLSLSASARFCRRCGTRQARSA